jgi:uncharacterized Zn-binding protein involved in type VI secretion
MPITGGAPTVLIGGRPAARAGDICPCVTTGADVIVGGSKSVIIAGKPAARIGDKTQQGGVIKTGHSSVIIGG